MEIDTLIGIFTKLTTFQSIKAYTLITACMAKSMLHAIVLEAQKY